MIGEDTEMIRMGSIHQTYLRTIRIFIASPSDLKRERTLFPKIINHVNEIKAHFLGFHLFAVSWEDVPPRRGRPQGLINIEIAPSDLLVMLLWKRWGTPTGKYSSGFEEEYEFAKELNEKRGTPQIWLYFREIPEEMLKDPRRQLQKVLQFRKKIEREHAFLYTSYLKEKDWKEKFEQHLCKWLDEKYLDRLAEAQLVAYTPEFGGIGGAALYIGEYRRVEKNLLDIKRSLEEVREKRSFNYFLTLYHLAVLYNHLGKNEDAERFCKEAVELSERLQDINKEWKCKVFVRLHRIYRDLGKLGKAETCFREAEEIARNNKISISPIEPVPLYIRYRTPRKIQNAKEIIQGYLKGLPKKGRALPLCQLGRIYFLEKDYKKAQKVFKKSFNLYREYGGSKIQFLICAVHYYWLCKVANNPRKQKELREIISRIAEETGIQSVDGINIQHDI